MRQRVGTTTFLSFILLLLSLVLCRLPINHLKLKESERTGLESEQEVFLGRGFWLAGAGKDAESLPYLVSR